MNLHIPDVRILEVHPTPAKSLHNSRRPSSILEERNELGVPLLPQAILPQAIEDAAKLGYNFLTVGGEEPLNYPGLPVLCREAHRHGMLTSMVTRGAALTAPQLAWLRFSIDLLGVELEGKPAGPNRRKPAAGAALSIAQSAAHSTARSTRQSTAQSTEQSTAQSTEQRLALIRDSGVPFAIVFPLTHTGMAELEWVADFAAAQGAAMLQVQPSADLTEEQMATAWMMVEFLSELQRGKLVIQLDAVNRYSLPADLGDLAAWKRDLRRDARRLGEVISPLVIEADGTVTPLRHGFPRRFAFGNLRTEGLDAMTKRWIESHAGAFCKVYGKVLHQARTADRMFGDLYQMLSIEAQRGEYGMPAVN